MACMVDPASSLRIIRAGTLQSFHCVARGKRR